MIASCRKAVVKYSKPVLFKPQSRQSLPFMWLGVASCPGERGDDLTTKENEL
jgi:hypothetical protein